MGGSTTEEKLNFAKLSINKTNAIEWFAMARITVFDGCRTGIPHMIACRA
jgi:hypothetical protein